MGIDAFTGTGTFIVDLINDKELMPDEKLPYKYHNEIHCNEIMLLAYYIASINIENVYHDIVGEESGYQAFDGICLTDTFQLGEESNADNLYSDVFPYNSKRVQEQKKKPITVIIGNPPYSVGQKSANDNAQNLSYPGLDGRIEKTYAKYSEATLKSSLYDSYIKAFRWASDRILSIKDGGIVCFISNGAWIDGLAQDGMRKCLKDEFTTVYVLNLRGNQRTSGELSRKEGGKIFGSGSRTPITITLLVKNPNKKQEKAKIYYHDIGDYLTRDQKLKMVKDFRSIENVEWKEIMANEKNDWINQRDGIFDTLINLGDKDDKMNKSPKFFNAVHTNGLKTQRDAWCYNFSSAKVKENMQRMISFYNIQREGYQKVKESTKAEDYIDLDETKINWTSGLIGDLRNNVPAKINIDGIIKSLYRPYNNQKLYCDYQFNERQGIKIKCKPSLTEDNLFICVSGVGVNKGFSCLITDLIPDLGMIGSTQCYPLYWYEENKNKQRSLFDEQTGDKYIRRDGITDWILREVRSRYHASNITKEMIFYYVYGLLHSEDYRARFAADLKKSLPRIPIVENLKDFMDFYLYGKKLADLHLNYENVAPCPGVVVIGDRKATGAEEDYDYFHIWDKMRFKSKDDKSTIIYNGNITIENIPQKAYEYIVNGKSAIEWIVERYCVSRDKKSLIMNDCNDWGKEHKKPRYILDLLLSVINVSVQTVDIVKALPKLKFE